MFVSRLKIKNWKNFRDADIPLGHRLFIIGPNASGKSNFLDVFKFLRDICLSRGGGLRYAVEARGGISTIRCLSARKFPTIAVGVELKDDGGNTWSYDLSFDQDKQRVPVIKEEVVKRNTDVLLKRPDDEDKKDPPRLGQTSLEQITTNKKFREIVKFFQTVSYQHLIPQLIRDPQAFSPKQIDNDPFGRDFLQRVENTSSKFKDSRLRKILRALRVAVPQLEELKVVRDKNGIPHLHGLFKHWRPNAAKQNETQFSDGTLRLFGLLWILFEGEGLLAMEEPELSLHPEVIRRIPEMIAGINRQRKIKRQIFISTHSEEMLRNESVGGEEVIRLEPGDNGTVLRSPMDDPTEREQLEAGLTPADVLLPASAPKNIGQLSLVFNE